MCTHVYVYIELDGKYMEYIYGDVQQPRLLTRSGPCLWKPCGLPSQLYAPLGPYKLSNAMTARPTRFVGLGCVVN